MPMEIDKAPYAAAPGAGPHEGVPGSGRPRRAARYRARLGEALRWVGSVAARLLLRRVVTVCLEQDSVSIVVLRGRRLVAWGRVNLEEAWDTLAPGASPVDSEAVDMIRGLGPRAGSRSLQGCCRAASPGPVGEAVEAAEDQEEVSGEGCVFGAGRDSTFPPGLP